MSTTQSQNTDAPQGHRTTPPLTRAWRGLVDGLGALGTMMIVVLMLIIFADVLVRNVAGGSLPMVAELGAMTVVMIVYLQLATTIRHDRLARTELFYVPFRTKYPRAGAVLGGVYDLAAALTLGAIAWSTLSILTKDYTRGEYIGVTGIATLPTWPFRVAILAGLIVSTLQALVQIGTALRALRTPSNPSTNPESSQ